MRRIFKPRQTGLDETAPFWRGERAEAIVAARIASYPPRKVRSAGTASIKSRSPSAEIRRLERALARRKTADARARLAQRIDALKRGL